MSNIVDPAGLFGVEAIEAARKELRQLERDTNVAALIQTVESLRGQKIADAAVRAARQSQTHGIFILIAKNEKEIELLVAKKYLETLTAERQKAIRTAFIDGFKKRDFDEGLRRGVAAIEAQLSAARHAGALPKNDSAAAVIGFSAVSPNGGSPLVVHNQVRLGLAGAKVAIAGAQARAVAMKLIVNVAVVDDGGHLVAFERMDGARPASVYTAITKATSAATFRQATGPLPAGTTTPDPLFNISLQNAAMAGGGTITSLHGGLPLVVDGQTIGAIGVAGGSGEQDAEIARAGVQALVDQLAASHRVEKEPDDKVR